MSMTSNFFRLTLSRLTLHRFIIIGQSPHGDLYLWAKKQLPEVLQDAVISIPSENT